MSYNGWNRPAIEVTELDVLVPLYVKPHVAIKILGISRFNLKKMAKQGKIPYKLSENGFYHFDIGTYLHRQVSMFRELTEEVEANNGE